jgi:hypothetical protein
MICKPNRPSRNVGRYGCVGLVCLGECALNKRFSTGKAEVRKTFTMSARLARIGRLALLIALVSTVLCCRGAQAQDLQAELDSLGRSGGGTYQFEAGDRVPVSNGVVIPRGVTLDLNGGELIAILSQANAAGVRMLSDTALRNGTVIVISRGSPGIQAGAHAAVLIGALYGENVSPAHLSPFESPSNWVVSNVILRSDKLVSAGDGTWLGAAGIQVVGGAHDGVIENVTIPDSARMAGGVLLDWGTVGPISSADIPASAAAFRRGEAYTTHPHDIVIRHIRIGRLTRPVTHETGSFGVRLSGVHDITVSDVTAQSVSEAAFMHTAGDLGYEFARPSDRARAHRGIVVDGVHAAEIDGGYLIRSDSYADNVGRAAERGYRPMLDPIAYTDIIVRNASGRAGGAREPRFGLRIDHERGGRFSNIAVTGFRRGIVIDEQVYDVVVERPSASDSIEAAISVGHPYRPPADITISDPQVAGRDDQAKQLLIGRSSDVSITGSSNAVVRVARGASGLALAGGLTVHRD